MNRQIDIETAVRRIQDCMSAQILVHSHPDGDTLGAGYALAHALQALGKSVSVLCEDPLPDMFLYMQEGLRPQGLQFLPSTIISVDVADLHLLGKEFARAFEGRIDLNIDHHATNTFFARETLLDSDAAATAEIVSDVIDLLGVPMTKQMAACLYAGVSTDTGCFRYSNTTARSHRYAARYMELGVVTEPLDRVFFETRTKTYMALERLALDGLQYHCGGRCALIAVTQEMYAKSGSNEDEYIKIVARTRQIEGVLVGVAIRERTDGTFKLSLRTHDPVDAAAICQRMGGGGHIRAAGCSSELPLRETIDVIVKYVEEALAAV